MVCQKIWFFQPNHEICYFFKGRIIRHRNDYGAVILADERFSETYICKQLSRWLQPHIKVYPTFGEATQSLTRFFKSKQNPTSQVSNDQPTSFVPNVQPTAFIPNPPPKKISPVQIPKPPKPENINPNSARVYLDLVSAHFLSFSNLFF